MDADLLKNVGMVAGIGGVAPSNEAKGRLNPPIAG